MNKETVVKALLNCVTEHDNTTHDVFRWLALLAVVAGLAYQGWAVIGLEQVFSMNDFGLGIGALFAGVGVALGFKKETD